MILKRKVWKIFIFGGKNLMNNWESPQEYSYWSNSIYDIFSTDFFNSKIFVFNSLNQKFCENNGMEWSTKNHTVILDFGSMTLTKILFAKIHFSKFKSHALLLQYSSFLTDLFPEFIVCLISSLGNSIPSFSFRMKEW